jgi:hypothetical protein
LNIIQISSSYTEIARFNLIIKLKYNSLERSGTLLKQIKQKMTLTEEIIAKRYWPLEKIYADEYPCSCSDPAHSHEGDHWSCDHGDWKFFRSEAEMEHNKPGHSYSICVGNCKEHPLLEGIVLDLHLANELGIGWGDIICDKDAEERRRETPEQKQKRLADEKRKEEETLCAIAQGEIRKAKECAAIRKEPLKRIYDRRSGKPMPCKWALRPAENGWPAGCGKHLEKVCPYFHPGEPEWAIIEGKAAWSAPPVWRK